MKRIEVKKLPLNEYTPEGSYWVEVDGQKVGEFGRCFWEKRSEAFACGMRFLNNPAYLAQRDKQNESPD